MAADGRPGLVIGMAVGQLRRAVDLRGVSPRRCLVVAVGRQRPSQSALLGLGGLELFEPVHHARQGQVFGGEVVHVADVDERHMQAVHI